jgi:hypothetical protein
MIRPASAFYRVRNNGQSVAKNASQRQPRGARGAWNSIFIFFESIAKALKKRSVSVVPALCRRKRRPSAQLSTRFRLELRLENKKFFAIDSMVK